MIAGHITKLSIIFSITNSIGAQFHYDTNRVGYTAGGFGISLDVQ